MSMFYCNRCDTVQDSDIVGIVAMSNGKEACDIEPYTYDEPYNLDLNTNNDAVFLDALKVYYPNLVAAMRDAVLLDALKVYYPNLVAAMNTKITQKNNFQKEA